MAYFKFTDISLNIAAKSDVPITYKMENNSPCPKFSNPSISAVLQMNGLAALILFVREQWIIIYYTCAQQEKIRLLRLQDSGARVPGIICFPEREYRLFCFNLP